MQDGVATTGSITLGQNTISSATFAAQDAGKAILVQGAGAAGVALVTTIASVVAGVAHLAANAGTTVTGSQIFYGTNNTSGINAWITAANAGTASKRGYLPDGEGKACVCTGQLSAHDTAGLKLFGDSNETAPNILQSTWPASSLLFLGDGTGWTTNSYGKVAFIDARSSDFRLEDVGVLQGNGGYTGLFLDRSHSAGASDSTFAHTEGCTFASVAYDGTHYYMNATAHISMAGVITSTIEKCSFARAQAGIRGQEGNVSSIIYSNANAVRDCMFIQTPTAIMNPGQNWTIESNTAEGLQQSAPDYLHHFIGDDIVVGAGYTHDLLTIYNNWCGDAFGDQVWIKLRPSFLTEIVGNLLSGGNGGVQFDGGSGIGGVAIRRNEYDTGQFAIDLGAATNWNGLEISVNDLGGSYSSGVILNLPQPATGNDHAWKTIGIWGNRVTNSTALPQPSFGAVTLTPRVNDQTGNYTLALVDAGTIIEFSGASAHTLTIPTNASVPFPEGAIVSVVQLGSGGVTVVAPAGGTLRVNPAIANPLAAANATAKLVQRGVDDWYMTGGI